jgi:hypothetical protein
MEAAATTPARPRCSPDHLLLRACLSVGALTVTRPTARERLDATLGPELTRRLLAGLTAGSRR